MSSSFTDQPLPHDPRSDDGYTSTPPTPEREWDDLDNLDTRSPRLGSLAQKARRQTLQRARVVLFLAGAVTIIFPIIDIAMFHANFQEAVKKEVLKQGGPGRVQFDPVMVQQAEDNAFVLCCFIDGAFIVTGVVLSILGALVYRFPVPTTIAGLMLYLLTLGAGLAVVSIGGEAEDIAKYLAGGVILRLAIIIGLATSIKSALAYENERRVEREFDPV